VQHHGHNDQALALFEASLALQQAHCGDKQTLSFTLNALGWTAHAMGEDVRADALLTEALNLRRELGDKRGIAVSLNNIGAVVQDRGDNIRAKPFFVESLALFQDLGNNWYIAHCLQQLAAVMITEEHPQRAAHLCAAAQALREAINAPMWPSARAHYEQIVSTVREQLGQAAFAAIWADGSTMPLDQTVAYALRSWE
jgi:tetratricopeptide (TPR) repeat protein